MAEFPHLKLPFKIEGVHKSFGGGNNKKSAITEKNLSERKRHGDYLKKTVDTIINNWSEIVKTKKETGYIIPNENDIPLFFRIDTGLFNIDTLVNWGIDIISEEENGYIIGASTDGLKQFQENVDGFLNQAGIRKDKAAQIWELVADDSWRVAELLKGELKEIWDSLKNDKDYLIEIGVSCQITNTKKYPDINRFDSEEEFQKAIEEYNNYELEVHQLRDLKQIERENEIQKYIDFYSGTLCNIWDIGTDALYFKIKVNGAGLRDLVLTYQYIFEVKLDSLFSLDSDVTNLADDFAVEILAPNNSMTKVCVIDSGIQENHRLLSASIDTANSRSYVDGDASTADYVKQSGHGTKVAGAILYPVTIPRTGQYQVETIIQNARILDKDNRISDSKFAPKLFEQIVKDYSETRIFNLSVSNDYAYIGTHMPSLAASIDKLIHQKDILFIIAAGNLKKANQTANNPGITEHLHSGTNYPEYLSNSFSKIANPGVSYFGITVGSIGKEDFEDQDYKVMAGKNYVSPFSRVGLGMWGCIKPDVVEFGGDYIKNKLSLEFKTNEITSPLLVNSTMHGATLVGNDSCGTSFSAPKVSYIASKLQSEHPKETAQMYRALIIQSARLPDHCFNNPSLKDISFYGYGLPNINRALNNTQGRITFIQSGKVGPKKADIYRLNIPRELRGEATEFAVLVEVTLCFTAKTRLTRKGSHSYLANWLEWKSSRYNESFLSFRSRTIKYLDDENENENEQDLKPIRWCLRENSAWAENEINRNNSTAQKSWAIIEPYQFSDEFSIAVIGHSGWDKNLEIKTDYSLCVSFEAIGKEINIYNLLAEAQVEIEPEQEIEI